MGYYGRHVLTGGWRWSYKLLKARFDPLGGYRRNMLGKRMTAGLWAIAIGFLLEIWLCVWLVESDKVGRIADTQKLLDRLNEILDGKD